MKNFAKIFTLVLVFALSSTAMYAQKDEIKAFEKINKDMLKAVKKQYKEDPEVKMASDQSFYLVLEKKIGKGKTAVSSYMLLDEAGAPLYNDWVDSYQPIGGSGYIFIGLAQPNGKKKFGAVDTKGNLILEPKYYSITQSQPLEAGNYTVEGSTYWHPATKGFWVTYDNDGDQNVTFFSLDGKNITHQYKGVVSKQINYFWKIDQGIDNKDNKCGFYTYDGEEIFPQEFNRFYIEKSGLVNSIKREEDGTYRYGGRLLGNPLGELIIPAVFQDVTYDKSENKIKARIHRADDYEEYNPAKTYTVSYKDEGEKLFDQGKYKDVITYYEGVGLGAVWGYYYMGLAAANIAKDEQAKMDRCLNTLKSSTNYYLPIEHPERYKYDVGTISGMYTSASGYLFQYISSDKVAKDDPTMLKARQLRGEMVTASNALTAKINEYGDALSAATTKNIRRKAAQAEQEAASNRLANSIASGIMGLFK